VIALVKIVDQSPQRNDGEAILFQVVEMLDKDRGGDRHAVGDGGAKTVIKKDRHIEFAGQEGSGEKKNQQ